MGCTDTCAVNFDYHATYDDGSCIDKVYGCTDSAALNFNSLANVIDGSCTYAVPGCTDRDAFNFNILATEDDSSCIAKVPGCTESSALNYNSLANVNDGSCEICPVTRTESGPITPYVTCMNDADALQTIWASYIGEHTSFSTNNYSLARTEMNSLYHTGEQMDTMVLRVT
jgi:hypothetical protein